MVGKFELYRDKAGEFRFRLKAENGESILASEGYKRRASAMNAIASVQKNATNGGRYERKESRSGKPMFNLKAANGQVIGTSEMYEDKSRRDQGIVNVMRTAAIAGIEEFSIGPSPFPHKTGKTVFEIRTRRDDVLKRLANR